MPLHKEKFIIFPIFLTCRALKPFSITWGPFFFPNPVLDTPTNLGFDGFDASLLWVNQTHFSPSLFFHPHPLFNSLLKSSFFLKCCQSTKNSHLIIREVWTGCVSNFNRFPGKRKQIFLVPWCWLLAPTSPNKQNFQQWYTEHKTNKNMTGALGLSHSLFKILLIRLSRTQICISSHITYNSGSENLDMKGYWEKVYEFFKKSNYSLKRKLNNLLEQ